MYNKKAVSSAPPNANFHLITASLTYLNTRVNKTRLLIKDKPCLMISEMMLSTNSLFPKICYSMIE